MCVKIIGNAICAIWHPYPVITDIAYTPDIRQFRIVDHPILGNTGAAESQVHKGLMVCIGVGNRIHTVAITSCCTAHTNRNNTTEFKSFVGSVSIAIMVKRHFCLKTVMHGKILVYIPLSRLRTVTAALTPEVSHMGQGEMSRGDFFSQCFLAGSK